LVPDFLKLLLNSVNVLDPDFFSVKRVNTAKVNGLLKTRQLFDPEYMNQDISLLDYRRELEKHKNKQFPFGFH
jgi:hypothetical protein